ncbi:MAG: metal ABC transporter substrate-binding protein [Oscillospiraceae bacterium]
MKRKIIILILILSIFSLSACGVRLNKTEYSEKQKINVVSTIFPSYDYVREISKGCNVELKMLLKPGTESHSYEPSPNDIVTIQNCDVFIYNGGESDVWVDYILETVDNPNMRVIKLMDCVKKVEEVAIDGMHVHENNSSNEETEYDEHVWTSPLNAIEIVKNITNTLIEIDPQNSEIYNKNSKDYISELLNLDNKIRDIIKNSKKDTLIFGDRFPFRYFTDEYGLKYFAAFPGCSSESEPSAKTIAFLVDKIKNENISYVMYTEFSNHKIADTLALETGAKIVRFHSCHNISKMDMDNGVTYIDLMEENCKILREALS